MDFLEKHPDYVISGHDAFVIDEHGNRIRGSRLPDRHKRDFTAEELILGKTWIPTMSRIYRNVLGESPLEQTMVINGDAFFASLIGHFGKSKYHPEILPAAYRKHAGGVWSMVSARERIDQQINTQFWLYRYYSRTGQPRYAHHYWRRYLGYVFRATSSAELLSALFRRWLRWGLR